MKDKDFLIIIPVLNPFQFNLIQKHFNLSKQYFNIKIILINI